MEPILTRYNIVKKCFEAMNAEQQDQVIETCVTIVTNKQSVAIPASASRSVPVLPTKKVAAKTRKVSGRGKATPLVVAGTEYKSFAKFCDLNNLKKSTVYKKYKTIKTPNAKAKFLEETLYSRSLYCQIFNYLF